LVGQNIHLEDYEIMDMFSKVDGGESQNEDL
jgi:hypothetical protein